MRLLNRLLLGLALGCTACTPSAPRYPWFSFAWYGEQLGKHYFNQLAMLVPVRVGSLRAASFVAQFDLGSDASILYENPLRNYFSTRYQLYAAVDTTHPATFDTGIRNYPTTNLPLRFGPNQIAHPVLAAQSGDPVPTDSLWTSSQKLVGTIGGDFLRHKVLVIDYPGRRMCVLDSVDAYWEARTRFVAGRVRHNRLQIPLTVNQHTYWAVFDTGSSLFPLSTSEPVWRQLVGARGPSDTLSVSSWGQQVAFYGAPVQASVYLGAIKLPPARAWFTRDPRHLAFAQAEHVEALTGNAFFSNEVVVLDFKRGRLGIVQP